MGSNRFAKVTGPLYDPVNGWNGGYRVLAGDLLTAIPLTPFTPISTQRNIPFGQPADEESESIGFMPFKWIPVKGNVPDCVHPLFFELQRAKAIREIYRRLMHDVSQTGWFFDNDDEDLEKFFKKYVNAWNEWNYPSKEHEIEEYPNRSTVVYGDFFERWSV